MRVNSGHTGASDMARKYRDKFGMEMPTRTLARIMAAENPLMFGRDTENKSIEAARRSLLYIESKMGASKFSPNAVMASKYRKDEPRDRLPFNFPEPESDDLVPVDLHWKDFIVASDFHIPNHRLPPIECMVNYAYENGVTNLLINGDLLDNTPFTRWEREPVSGLDVKRWFDQAEDFLREMKKHFKSIIWLEGNHDFWYTRWLLNRAEILFGDPYYSLTARLHLDDIGVTYYDQKNLLKAGKLFISHGHILIKSGGVHAAATVLRRSGVSHLIGHVHREQTFTKSDITGSIHTGFTTGCMCTLSPEYQRYGGESCHGFAHVKVKDDGDFKVRNMRIHNGEIL